MSSNNEGSLANAGSLAAVVAAIEQLAAEADGATPEAAVGRLAGLWAMVAQLDPAVAERLAGYAGEAE